MSDRTRSSGGADRLALRRADGFGMVLKLAKDLRLADADFVDQLAVPQAVVEVLQLVERLDLELVIGREGVGRLLGRAAGRGINRG